ncbi:MAG: DUF6498-containing protein [Dehalococcoidia bacterium]|nr:DUF6498-containing protein [Dehalococcoidia bacterium]
MTSRKARTATPIGSQPRGNLFQDWSLWLLLVTNGVTIAFAVIQDWNVLALMWVYWFQNIVIGFFSFLRIRRLREFSTEGFSINGHSVEPTEQTKNDTARFFLLHYGGFHLGYFIFLLIFSLTGMFSSADGDALNSADLKYIIPTALLFLGNHVFSDFYNRPRDTGRQKIGWLMAYPYARVIPMHLTILLGAFLGGGLLLFLVLKTLADAIMHVVEHRILLRGEVRRGQETAESEQETGGSKSSEKQVAAEEKPGTHRGRSLIWQAILPAVCLGLCKLSWDTHSLELVIICFIAFIYFAYMLIKNLVNFMRKRD